MLRLINYYKRQREDTSVHMWFLLSVGEAYTDIQLGPMQARARSIVQVCLQLLGAGEEEAG